MLQFGERNVIKKKAEKILKYEDLIIRTEHMWNENKKSDISNNRGNWNHLKIIHKYLSNVPIKR